jgi:Ca2+-binding EF-hand superfamily protein
MTFAALLAASLGSVALAENMPMDGGMQGCGMQGGGMRDGGMREGGPFLNFDQIDADKDGKITLAEMEAFRAARFAGADANADGNLSAEELVAMHEAERAARQLQRSTDMIAKFDTNADGALSAEELPQPGNFDQLFDRIDTDKDGAISKAEADAAMEMMGGHRGKGMGQGWGHDNDDN